MDIFAGLEKIVETDHNFAQCTWYGLGGKADYYITPETVEQLGIVVQHCRDNSIPIRILGFGSNLLISDDGVKGAVIKLEGEDFRNVDFDGEKVTAWAGAELSKMVYTCTEKGLSGLEAMTGIPGSVGGAVMMNAGGRFGDFGAVIESVTLMDREGKIFEKSKPELMFDYRSTNITALCILNAKLVLSEADSNQILRTVKEVWIYKKNHQPLNTKNAGCIFKNSRGVSAGALIDRAGLKGLKIGGAVVSEKHANFIVAEEGCKSKDVIRLIEVVKERIREKFEIDLELEIEIWK